MHRIAKSGLVILVLLALQACSTEKSADEYFASAERLAEEKNYQAAIIELKNAIKASPRDPDPRALLGRLEYELGDYPSAQQGLATALKLGAPASEVTPLLAQTLLLQGELSQLAALEVSGLNQQAYGDVIATQVMGKLRDGDTENAHLMVQLALEQAPQSLRLQVASAMIDAAPPRKNIARARRTLENVLQRDPEMAEAWTLTGDLARYEGNLEAAEEAYSRVTRLGGKHRHARLNRAFIRAQRGDFEGAQDDLEVLGKALPRHPGINFLQGVIQLKQQQLEAAEASFTRVVELGDDHAPSLFGLATALYLQGKDERAMEWATQFVEAEPDNSYGRTLLAALQLRQKQFAAAESTLQPVVDFDPNPTNQAKRMYALAQLRQGKAGEAADVLEQINSEQPGSPKNQLGLAIAYLQSGDNEAAYTVLQDLQAGGSDTDTAEILLTLNDLRSGNREEADRRARGLTERSPSDPEIYIRLGMAYLNSGDSATARGYFRRALELAPDNTNAALNLAVLALAEEDPVSGRRYLTQALDSAPGDERALLLKAALEGRENNPQAARASLEAAVAANPESRKARVALAHHLLESNETSAALVLFPDFRSARDAHPDVLMVQARAQLQLRNYLSARDILLALQRAIPEDGRIQYLLASAYAGTGEPRKVRRHLEKAVELAPDNYAARLALARMMLLEGENEKLMQQLVILEERWPEQADVMGLVTVLAMRSGDEEAAVESATAAFDKTPSMRNLLILIRLKLRAGDVAEAQALQSRWEKENTITVHGYQMLGEIYASEGLFTQSRQAYEASLEKAPNNLLALNNLAWHLRKTDTTQALVYAKRAYEINPSSTDVVDTLAMVSLEAGDNVEAQRYINRALGKRPEDPGIRYHSAIINAALGNDLEALQTLSSLVEEEETFEEYDEAVKLLHTLQSSAGSGCTPPVTGASEDSPCLSESLQRP